MDGFLHLLLVAAAGEQRVSPRAKVVEAQNPIRLRDDPEGFGEAVTAEAPLEPVLSFQGVVKDAIKCSLARRREQIAGKLCLPQTFSEGLQRHRQENFVLVRVHDAMYTPFMLNRLLPNLKEVLRDWIDAWFGSPEEEDTLDAALAAARRRFPDDPIYREVDAVAELELRKILGQRLHDA